MKVLIIVLLVVIVINMIITGCITHIIFRKKDVSLKIKRSIFVLLFVILCSVMIVGTKIIVENKSYKADDRAISFLNSDDTVKVRLIDNVYYFDGPGDDKAFIFYPGAFVEPSAYAAVMHDLSEEGIDCFLVKMPLNFAFLGIDFAEDIMEEYNYKKWFLGGHSLGGAMASIYAESNQDSLDGMILMASFSTKKLNGDMKLISLVGDKDKVLKKDTYIKNKINWPDNSKEYIIKGGNHAGFGDYGSQKGDGNASISTGEQQEISVEEIIKFID